MMDNQLEQVRDIWVNAFFTGNYEVLAQYEDEHFKVVYEQTELKSQVSEAEEQMLELMMELEELESSFENE